MMMKGLFLAASILALGTISGPALARTAATHADRMERMSAHLQMQNGSWESVAAKPMTVSENDPYAYHGGPKSNE